MNTLALPSFQPKSCECNKNSHVYNSLQSWNQHKKTQRHESFEKDNKIKIQQQLLTSKENEISRLCVVINEKENEIKKIRDIYNGIVKELKNDIVNLEYEKSYNHSLLTEL